MGCRHRGHGGPPGEIRRPRAERAANFGRDLRRRKIDDGNHERAVESQGDSPRSMGFRLPAPRSRIYTNNELTLLSSWMRRMASPSRGATERTSILGHRVLLSPMGMVSVQSTFTIGEA